MTITEKKVTVRDLVAGYSNDDELGVRGYGGRLDVRPPYQREFIYNEQEQEAVIHTVLCGFPLNVMYWVRRSADATCPYEVMDGQQRTLSLCEYVAGKFCYDFKFFFNQPADVQQKILDYELQIYVCEGLESEKLAWFRTINIAGKQLTEQELRNAVYGGPFVADAKRHFSKRNCAAWHLAKDLVSGSLIRQEFLERALIWMAAHETRSGRPQTLEGYMATHQHDPNANNLWTYFQNVCNWALTNFNARRFARIMKGLDWALFYDRYATQTLNVEAMARRIGELLGDGEVQNARGIIPYVLTGDESCLSLRTFPENIKLAAYNKQKGCCNVCGKPFEYAQMEGDHIVPWSKGGRTTEENCQMLCRACNRRKSAK